MNARAHPTHRTRLAVESMEDRSVPSAAPLDASFGAGGFSVRDLGTPNDGVAATAVDAAGRTVVAVDVGAGANGYDFTLVRYTAGGEIDTSFGDGGFLRTDFAGGNDYVIGLAIDAARGHLYAVGTAQTRGGLQDVGVARYDLATGTLDRKWGKRGLVTVEATAGFADIRDFGHAVAVDPAGRVLVCGSSNGRDGEGFYTANTLFRFRASGGLDRSFGRGGMVVGAPVLDGTDSWRAMTLVPAAGAGYRVAVVGTSGDAAVFARFNSDGSRDTSLAAGGAVTLAHGDPGHVEFVPGGGAFVGARAGFDGSYTIVRYTAAGTPDASFDGDGIYLGSAAALTGDLAATLTISDVAVDTTGRIVLAGALYTGSFGGDSLLIRHTATGELDASFDGDGWAAYALAPDRAETFTHVAIDGEGRI
ncbi:MAG TPA: SBBP repeat-containing protein, partial [Gemmata sp.]|nr:SBBP repeat-containing protein [Gemmata sp.]